MKICHLILTHSFAGSERYAIELANAQAERHEVHMVLHRRAAQQRPQALAHRLDARVQLHLVGGWGPLATRAARLTVQALRPDVAHAHLSGGCRALGKLRLPGCLRVASLHIHYKPQQHARLDALIALTPAQLQDIPEPLRAHSVQVDNWTLARAAAPGRREALRQAWGVPEDAMLIGTLGRVEQSKGHELLLDAAQPLLAEGGVRLAIVGGGRDWQRLRRRADPRVIMPGFVDQPADCLAAFDLFVSAAHSEPFGLVFLEAMAAGLPIVATETAGALHLGPRHGWRLLPCGDARALQLALREAIASRPARRVYDLQPYAVDERAAAIEAFYREQLALRGVAHAVV